MTPTELLTAADRLDAEGDHALAAEARAEAALPPRTPPAPAVIRCDVCDVRITSARRIERYDAMGVDWTLCGRCDERQREHGPGHDCATCQQ